MSNQKIDINSSNEIICESRFYYKNSAVVQEVVAWRNWIAHLSTEQEVVCSNHAVIGVFLFCVNSVPLKYE